MVKLNKLYVLNNNSNINKYFFYNVNLFNILTKSTN